MSPDSACGIGTNRREPIAQRPPPHPIAVFASPAVGRPAASGTTRQTALAPAGTICASTSPLLSAMLGRLRYVL